MTATMFEYDFTKTADWLSQGCSFWSRDEILSKAFSRVLPDRAADLMDVMGAVYAADRRSKRIFNGTATGQRRIGARIPVRDPGAWSLPELVSSLRKLLSWVSGDVWDLEFTGRARTEGLEDGQGVLFEVPLEAPVNVSLFSGGLDSLAGLAHHAIGHPGGSRVLVSGCTHNRLSSQQAVQVNWIRSAWAWGTPAAAGEVRHVAVPFGVDAEDAVNEEKGQRTRALLFLAMGVNAALQAGAEALHVFENGVGALNLPLNGTQLGTDNYRGVHPRTLAMAESLFESILEKSVRIDNPFMFTTKAEMCRALPEAGLATLVRETVSCDGYPQRVRGQAQCGCCTSCVLRRQALFCSGLAENDPISDYRRDILSGLKRLERNESHGFMVMDEQVKLMARCLESNRPWRELTIAYPELARTTVELAARPGAPGQEDLAASYVELFRTHVHEWNNFASEVAAAR